MRILCLMIAAALGAAAQQPPDRADIRELIQVSGGLAALDQLFSGATLQNQLRATLGNAPPDKREQVERFIQEFSKEFIAEAQTRREELLGLIANVYAKYYTPDDVKALIAFYRTPVGKKLAATSPKAAMESMQIGQKWGQELGAKIGARVGSRVGARVEAEQKK